MVAEVECPDGAYNSCAKHSEWRPVRYPSFCRDSVLTCGTFRNIPEMRQLCPPTSVARPSRHVPHLQALGNVPEAVSAKGNTTSS